MSATPVPTSPEQDPLAVLEVIDRLEVGPVTLLPDALHAPYRVVRGGAEDVLELVYRYEEPVFDPGDSGDRNLAAMIANPRDLVEPRGMTPRDGQRRDVIMDKYVRGDTTVAKKAEEEKKKNAGPVFVFQPTIDLPAAASWRSTTIWVAMPAWSVPGIHRVFIPCMRCQRTSMSCITLSMA